MGIWQKRLGAGQDGWNTQIKVNPTQVHAHMGHHVREEGGRGHELEHGGQISAPKFELKLSLLVLWMSHQYANVFLKSILCVQRYSSTLSPGFKDEDLGSSPAPLVG